MVGLNDRFHSIEELLKGVEVADRVVPEDDGTIRAPLSELKKELDKYTAYIAETEGIDISGDY